MNNLSKQDANSAPNDDIGIKILSAWSLNSDGSKQNNSTEKDTTDPKNDSPDFEDVLKTHYFSKNSDKPNDTDCVVICDDDDDDPLETDCLLVEEKDPLDTSDLAGTVPEPVPNLKNDDPLSTPNLDVNYEPAKKKRKTKPKIKVVPAINVLKPEILQNLEEKTENISQNNTSNSIVIPTEVYQNIIINTFQNSNDSRQQNLCTSTQIYDNYNHDIQNNLDSIKKKISEPQKPKSGFEKTFLQFAETRYKNSNLINETSYLSSRFERNKNLKNPNESPKVTKYAGLALLEKSQNEQVSYQTSNIGATSQNIEALQNFMTQFPTQNNSDPNSNNTILSQKSLASQNLPGILNPLTNENLTGQKHLTNQNSLTSLNNKVSNQNNTVLNQNNSILNQSNPVLNQNSSILNQNPILNQNNSVLNQNNSVLNQNISILNQNNSVLNQNNPLLNQNSGISNQVNVILQNNGSAPNLGTPFSQDSILKQFLLQNETLLYQNNLFNQIPNSGVSNSSNLGTQLTQNNLQNQLQKNFANAIGVRFQNPNFGAQNGAQNINIGGSVPQNINITGLIPQNLNIGPNSNLGGQLTQNINLGNNLPQNLGNTSQNFVGVLPQNLGGSMIQNINNLGGLPQNANIGGQNLELYNYFLNQIRANSNLSNYTPRGPYDNYLRQQPLNFENIRPLGQNLGQGPQNYSNNTNDSNKTPNTTKKSRRVKSTPKKTRLVSVDPIALQKPTQNEPETQNFDSNSSKNSNTIPQIETSKQNFCESVTIKTEKQNEFGDPDSNLNTQIEPTAQDLSDSNLFIKTETQIETDQVIGPNPNFFGENEENFGENANLKIKNEPSEELNEQNFVINDIQNKYNVNIELPQSLNESNGIQTKPKNPIQLNEQIVVSNNSENKSYINIKTPQTLNETNKNVENLKEGDTNQNDENFKWCLMCRKKFTKTNDLILHNMKHLLLNKIKSTFCILCNIKFNDREQYKFHLKMHKYRKSYFCRLCYTQCTGLSKIINHKKRRCKKNLLSKCQNIYQTLNDVENLTRNESNLQNFDSNLSFQNDTDDDSNLSLEKQLVSQNLPQNEQGNQNLDENPISSAHNESEDGSSVKISNLNDGKEIGKENEPGNRNLARNESSSLNSVQNEPGGLNLAENDPGRRNLAQNEQGGPNLDRNESSSPNSVRNEPGGLNLAQNEPGSENLAQNELGGPNLDRNESSSPNSARNELGGLNLAQNESGGSGNQHLAQNETNIENLTQNEASSQNLDSGSNLHVQNESETPNPEEMCKMNIDKMPESQNKSQNEFRSQNLDLNLNLDTQNESETQNSLTNSNMDIDKELNSENLTQNELKTQNSKENLNMDINHSESQNIAQTEQTNQNLSTNDSFSEVNEIQNDSENLCVISNVFSYTEKSLKDINFEPNKSTKWCYKCKKDIPVEFIIEKNLLGNIFKCFECPEIFKDRTVLINHYINKHWFYSNKNNSVNLNVAQNKI